MRVMLLLSFVTEHLTRKAIKTNQGRRGERASQVLAALSAGPFSLRENQPKL